MSTLLAAELSTLETAAIIVGIAVGVVSGVSGLVLGILNYWHQRDTTRPRIRVRPLVASVHLENRPVQNAGIMEVCNVGHIPVIGWTIGFRVCGEDKDITIEDGVKVYGDRWTDEFKPQHAAMLHFRLEDLPEVDILGLAFAKTVAGDMFKASRRDMRKFRKRLAELQH